MKASRIIALVLLLVVVGVAIVAATLNSLPPDPPTLAGVELNVTGRVDASLRQAYADLRPDFEFSDKQPPPAPDYWNPDTWAALPTKSDGADVYPANTKYPEAQATAKADVFFVHPTGYESDDSWNAAWDDDDAADQTLGMMLHQASAFNAAARVYAPRYRQFTIYGVLEPGPSGSQCMDLAYSDVARAFDHYLKFYNHGRPFILAGHSQGSFHALRLLQEMIIGKPVQKRLVAAYIIGCPVPQGIEGIKVSNSPRQVGALIAYTTYTDKGDPSFFTHDVCAWLDGGYVPINDRPLVQVNPLTWQDHGGPAAPELNPGSLPVAEDVFPLHDLVPGAVGADASGKVLRITEPDIEGYEGNDSGVAFLNADYGDFHNYDYMLFWESIRANAVARVKAYLGE